MQQDSPHIGICGSADTMKTREGAASLCEPRERLCELDHET